MKNIIDYALDYAKTFKEKPFNEVDALILSQLSYLNLGPLWEKRKGKPISIKELANSKNKHLYEIRRPEEFKKLVQAMAQGTRFSKLKIIGHITKTDQSIFEQFSVTAYVCNDIGFMAFRGTDRSIVGWSENFNMTYMDAVPSEIDAVKFMNNFAEDMPPKFYVGGHSKGGHLAIFASTYCNLDTQKRIIRIFNFDGPGLEESKYKSKEYANIEDKIITILPETSIFGIMLIHSSNYYVVKSNGLLLTQHEPFLWDIKYNSFVYERSLSPLSKRLKVSMANFIQNTTPEKRKAFFTVLNDFMEQSGGDRPLDITLNFTKTIPLFFSTYDKLPKEELKEIRAMMWELIKMFATLQTSGHSESTFKLVEGEKINEEVIKRKEKNQETDFFKRIKKLMVTDKKKNNIVDTQSEPKVEKEEDKTIVLDKPKITYNKKNGNSRSSYDIRSLLNFTTKQLDVLLNKIATPNKAKVSKNKDEEQAIEPSNITEKPKDPIE